MVALKKHSPGPVTSPGFPTHWVGKEIVATSPPLLIAPDGSTMFDNLQWYVLDLDNTGNGGFDYALKDLHSLVQPFKIRLTLDLFQNLMHQFSKYNVYFLWGCGSRLSGKISPGFFIVITFQPEISHLLRDNLTLPLILQLVFFNSLILVNPVHQLTNIGDRFPRQRFP